MGEWEEDIVEVVGKEAVVQWCSVKKLFLEISQNLQESTCARVSLLIKLQTLACKFIKKETQHRCFKNTFFHRTPHRTPTSVVTGFETGC